MGKRRGGYQFEKKRKELERKKKKELKLQLRRQKNNPDGEPTDEEAEPIAPPERKPWE